MMAVGLFILPIQFPSYFMDKYSEATTFIPFKEYPAINGLLGWLDPEVCDGKSDSEVINDYVIKLPDESNDALKQGRVLLDKDPWPWEGISKCFNRHFSNEQETHDWFEGILNMIEEERKKQGLL